MKSAFRSINSQVHLWLGLITAPLVFFICITGTIVVFSDEIMELSAGDARFVKEVKDQRLETEQLISILQEAFPTRKVPSYSVNYRDPHRSVRFNFFDPDKGLRMVYMDPYTGEILKDDGTIYFFYITAHLHNSLLWHGVGNWIIDIVVLIFLIELLSGLIMWWPKTWDKKHKKGAFTVNLKASGQRINRDVHKVVGFYGLGICLLLTVTGLIIAFHPLADATKNLFGGDASIEAEDVLVAANDSTKIAFPANLAIEQALQAFPDKGEVQLYTFRMNQWGYYAMNVAKKVGLKSSMSTEFYLVDKYTAKPLDLSKELRINEAVENMYWTLHMGNWMGILGKIITFLGGLISSMLPVTGFYIWWNKRKKNKRSRDLFSAELH